MSDLDDIFEHYRDADALRSVPFRPDQFSQLQTDLDGEQYGMVGEIAVPVGREPSPAAASAAPAPQAEENNGFEIGGVPIGDIETAFNAPFAGIARSVSKFIGNTAAAFGLVDQAKVDRFFDAADRITKDVQQDNLPAQILGGAGDIVGLFVVPAGAGIKLLKAAGASPFVASLVSDSLVGLLGMSPNDEALANMISEDASHPAAVALRDLMATDPDDPEWVNRSRNAAEAFALLGMSEAVVRSLPEIVRQTKQFVRTEFGQGLERLSNAGRAADERITELSRGGTMMANPIGAATDVVVSGAGRIADLASGKLASNDIRALLYRAEAPPPPPEGAKKWTKALLARKIQDEAEASGSVITKFDDAERDRLSTAIADEARAALQKEGNASDWYNAKILEMDEILKTIHPELQPGTTAEGIFKIGLALTSNGATVDHNLRSAEHIYSVFKSTGKFPEDLDSLTQAVGGFGQEGPTLVKQMLRANDMIDEMGADGFVKFLNTKFTVRELTKAGYKLSGEAVDFETYGSAIFGPKIGGGFYQNLRGNFEPITFDRWWMASWGRWTGQPLLKVQDKTKAKQLERFKNASGETFRNDADAISRAKDIYRAYRAANFQPRNELNTASQRLAESSTDSMREQPSSASERRLMREIAYAAVEKLRQQGYDITPADLQATVWYPEKELHGFYGIGSGTSAPDDYAEAAKRFMEAQNAGR